MALSSGARLGPYEVIAPLGAGGMGEVWRARDTRLGREVAIKVLAAELASDADRLKRFEREARAASALNHPNIVTIYEIERIDSVSFIVMELIHGKTLRELVADGSLPTKKLLAIAVQIAEGLAKTHSVGIVHRDLKPENVMVTKDGLLKLLDFGLAKLTHPEIDGGVSAKSATVAAGTRPGIVMGTVGYMSPEQASGYPLDFRSDQFSFGSILYEMATGKQPFKRGTAAQTLAAIIQDEPEPIQELNPDTPPPLRWIVEQCLAKEAEARYVSTQDLARDLARVRNHISEVSSSVETAAAPPRRRLLWPFAVAGLLAAFAALFLLGKRAGDRPIPSFERLTFRRGMNWTARFSPDGQTIVYGAAWDGGPIRVFTTRAGSVESRELDLPNADVLAISSAGEMAISLDRDPAAEPGGSFGTLATVPLAGGAPRAVAENVQGADWSPDGTTLAVVRSVGTRLRLEYPLGTLLYDAEGKRFESPRVSPDGKLVAYIESSGDGLRVRVADRATKNRTLVDGFLRLTGIAWSPKGDEIWFAAGRRETFLSLYAVNLAGRLRLVGTVPSWAAVMDISRDGRVLLVVGDLPAGIFAVTPGVTIEHDLSWLDSAVAADLSADGKMLLFNERPGAQWITYLRKTDGSAPPSKLGDGFALALSPKATWALTEASTPSAFGLLPTGPGQPSLIKQGSVEWWGERIFWFPDEKRFVIDGKEPGHAPRAYMVNIDGAAPRPLTPEGTTPVALSPDGRLLAARSPDQSLVLYPQDGDAPRTLPGSQEHGMGVGPFSEDGRFLYVRERQGLTRRIFRHDVRTGEREFWKEIKPADPTGVIVLKLLLAPNGKTYAYTCIRVLSKLFLVRGLK